MIILLANGNFENTRLLYPRYVLGALTFIYPCGSVCSLEVKWALCSYELQRRTSPHGEGKGGGELLPSPAPLVFPIPFPRYRRVVLLPQGDFS